MLIDTLHLDADHTSDLALRWQRTDTQHLLDLVAYEGASIWLYRRLRAVGALDGLPAEFGDRLRHQAFEDAASRMEVEAEAADVVVILDRAAVPLILIKGIARCALAERFPYIDARPTQDVDLLIPQARIPDADAALRADGYMTALAPGSLPIPGHHHLPPLHKGRITVELHASTSTRVPPEVAWTRANDRCEIVQWSGRSVRVPCATELVWSALTHAMEDEVAGFRLKRFLEVVPLVSHGAPIDWETLRERTATQEAFEPDAGVRDQSAVIRGWIGAALSLVAAEHRPTEFDVPEFALAELLAWRLAVLRAHRRIGRAFAERLMAEGARALVKLPREGSPPGATLWGRVCRGIAGRVSRATFGTWRAMRRD